MQRLLLLLLAGSFAELASAQVTTNAWIREQVEKAPLALKFTGKSADDARAWQTQFRGKLKELLGPHAPPKTWQTIVVQTKDFPDHRLEELILKHADHPSLPVYVLTPKNAKGKVPGIVALHGHGQHGHHPIVGREDLPGVANAVKNNHYDYGRQLVQRGYVVVAPCLTPFGARLAAKDPKTDACAETFVRLQALGKVLIAENVRDVLWCVELLAQRADVNAERLGCVGLSYGGRMTMLSAALEPRIKIAVVSGALNVFQERLANPYSCGAQIIPGLLKFGDVPEIGALIAPRTAVWETGTNDKLIVQPQAEDAWLRMKQVYRALGAEAELIRAVHDGGHVWHGERAVEVFAERWGK